MEQPPLLGENGCSNYELKERVDKVAANTKALVERLTYIQEQEREREQKRRASLSARSVSS